MSELFPMIPEAVHVAPKVARRVVQHAQNIKPACVAVLQGVTYMTALIYSAVSAIVAAGLAWYIRGRGMAGVKIDLDNAKKEIKKLKGNA
jgi:hypothetical protein